MLKYNYRKLISVSRSSSLYLFYLFHLLIKLLLGPLAFIITQTMIHTRFKHKASASSAEVCNDRLEFDLRRVAAEIA